MVHKKVDETNLESHEEIKDEDKATEFKESVSENQNNQNSKIANDKALYQENPNTKEQDEEEEEEEDDGVVPPKVENLKKADVEKEEDEDEEEEEEEDQ